MNFCIECRNKLEPVPPEYAKGTEAFRDAPTVDFEVHGVAIDGRFRVCISCYRILGRLEQKEW